MSDDQAPGPGSWQRRADLLSREHRERGDTLAWFERLYAEGRSGAVGMPWSRTEPHELLREWAIGRAHQGRAVVCGVGLGADAEFVAGLGYRTTAFDISPTAVDECLRRFPDTTVDYRVADLLSLPSDLLGGFDLVVEIFTLQAMPDPPRSAAAAGVVSLAAPGGSLVVVQFRDDGSEDPDEGPPFPLGGDWLSGLGSGVLDLVGIEALPGPLWRATYHRADDRRPGP